jgi:dienelactone hydrolase
MLTRVARTAALTLVLAGCAMLEPQADLSRGPTGYITFETRTPTDPDFLLGKTDAPASRIWGDLRLPSSGPERMPAVVLIHGSAGVGPSMTWWTKELHRLGVATFVVDSFSGRNIVETETNQTRLGYGAMLVDAYRALALAATHPRVDPDRIAVMGYSRGGIVALYTSLERFRRAWVPGDLRFAAHLAFYPACGVRILEDEDVSDRPIRIFHGEADDWTPVEPCREYVARLRAAGKDARLFAYPGARHAFDVPMLPHEMRLRRVENAYACRFVERERGVVVDPATGAPAGTSSPCVTRGATIGHHPEARRAAIADVLATLRQGLRLPAN